LGTIGKHLDVLKNRNSRVLSTYKELGLQTIPTALAKGNIDEKRAEELETLLKM
jgi:hypothetical protein